MRRVQPSFLETGLFRVIQWSCLVLIGVFAYIAWMHGAETRRVHKIRPILISGNPRHAGGFELPETQALRAMDTEGVRSVVAAIRSKSGPKGEVSGTIVHWMNRISEWMGVKRRSTRNEVDRIQAYFQLILVDPALTEAVLPELKRIRANRATAFHSHELPIVEILERILAKDADGLLSAYSERTGWSLLWDYNFHSLLPFMPLAAEQRWSILDQALGERLPDDFFLRTVLESVVAELSWRADREGEALDPARRDRWAQNLRELLGVSQGSSVPAEAPAKVAPQIRQAALHALWWLSEEDRPQVVDWILEEFIWEETAVFTSTWNPQDLIRVLIGTPERQESILELCRSAVDSNTGIDAMVAAWILVTQGNADPRDHLSELVWLNFFGPPLYLDPLRPMAAEVRAYLEKQIDLSNNGYGTWRLKWLLAQFGDE